MNMVKTFKAPWVPVSLTGLFAIGGFWIGTARAQWCQTTAVAGNCSQGTCDDPAERDAWVVPAPDHKIKVRLHFVVVADSTTCFNPVVTPKALDGQLLTLNDDYRDHGIQFQKDTTTLACDTRLRHLCSANYSCEPEASCCACWCARDSDECPDCGTTTSLEQLLKQNASNPDQRLNIFVVETVAAWDALATMPWCANALNYDGGIMIVGEVIGATDNHTLSHEIGHVLGLYHTNQSVRSDLGQCAWDCTDTVACNGSCSDPHCDRVGDLCCDTPATPGEIPGMCQGPSGTDICTSSTPWGPTDYTNYMGAARDGCWNHFTVRQGARMRCWGCDAVSSWIDSPDCNGNGKPDVCDISRGTSCDEDSNGVPDECQTYVADGACCIDVGPPQVCVETNECVCTNMPGFYQGDHSKCGLVDCSEGLARPQPGP